MKDIEDKLAAFLMEYGVLKNADAEKMAHKIAEMFEKERDDLSARIGRAKVTESELLADHEQICKERDQLAAKCAEMRRAIDRIYNHNEAARSAVIECYGLHHSDDCGKGWLSPEKAERLRDGLERMVGYAATVRLDRRKVIDGEVTCLQMEDWCNGLLDRVAESQKILDETK